MKPKGRFLPLDECPFDLWRTEILEGYVSLKVGEQEVLGEELWWELDVLWHMLVDWAEQLLEGNPYHDTFPGTSSIAVRVWPTSRFFAEILIAGPDIDRKAKAPIGPLCRCILGGAEELWDCLYKLHAKPVRHGPRDLHDGLARVARLRERLR